MDEIEEFKTGIWSVKALEALEDTINKEVADEKSTDKKKPETIPLPPKQEQIKNQHDP